MPVDTRYVTFVFHERFDKRRVKVGSFDRSCLNRGGPSGNARGISSDLQVPLLFSFNLSQSSVFIAFSAAPLEYATLSHASQNFTRLRTAYLECCLLHISE